MKKITSLILLFSLIIGFAQAMEILDSTHSGLTLENIPQDTNRVNALIRKSQTYYFSKPDSCLYFAQQAVELAHKLNFTKREIQALQIQGEAYRFLGDYPKSLESQFLALELARSIKRMIDEAGSLGFIGFTYSELGEYRQALQYLHSAKTIFEQTPGPVMEAFNLSNIGSTYEGLGLLDSALFFLEKASVQAQAFGHQNLIILTLRRLGNVRLALGDDDEALSIYHTALKRARKANDRVNPSAVQLLIADLHLKLNRKDSCLYYARRALADARSSSQKAQILEASNLMVNMLREKNMPDSVIYYQDIALAMKDSLFGADKFKQLQVLALREQQRKLDIVQEQREFRNRSRLLGLSGILVFVLAIAFILYKNYRQKYKINLILEEQKINLEKTLRELKAAQSHLIQSEKMASLGELTAGIAHEIQNPLNFVNNFSEVNKELIEEVDREIENGNFVEVKTILNDIKQNEEKINHHGKRADAIVKGMLQHSRASSGQKELTDINALCDEYLRLSYHGLRAKDKTFNARIETDFDASLEKINVVPQDIGRVILNLINNAFYAVN